MVVQSKESVMRHYKSEFASTNLSHQKPITTASSEMEEDMKLENIIDTRTQVKEVHYHEAHVEEVDLLEEHEEEMDLAIEESNASKEKLSSYEIQKQIDFQAEAMIHIDSLYNFAVRMTGDSEDANDLVQETYMKAYRFFESFEKGTNCKAWLFRILKNSYINRYRKESKQPDKVDYDDIKEFYHTIKHSSLDTTDTQQKAFGDLLSEKVSRALSSLPEDFREVVQLCDIEGFTYEEIANMVDCPIGTVRSRLHRGRKILRDKLTDYAANHGYSVDNF